MRPTVAEIDLRALVHNYKLLENNVRRHAGESTGAGVGAAALIAVIKANAYGHGLALCGQALAEAGAPWLGVTSVEEALELLAALRAVGGRTTGKPRVLVMSGFFPGEEDAVLEHGLTAQVWERWHLRLLQAAARRAGRGSGPGSGLVAVHLEIDTGMSRQGVASGEALRELLGGLGSGSALFVEGVLTHFSSPEKPDVTAGQVDQLRQALEQLRAAGIRPRWVHAGNSANALGVGLESLAGLAREFGAELLVRPGLALYGVDCDGRRASTAEIAEVQDAARPAAESEAGCAAGLEPVLRWKTQITSLREVAAGTPAGYGETFRAGAAGARLALLPVGYADGLRRELSGRGSVLVRGHRAPIVGRVSMDQTVVDVSAVPGAEIGDEVVLLGQQGAEKISAWAHAEWCGTIPYEVLCGVGKRVVRVGVQRLL